MSLRVIWQYMDRSITKKILYGIPVNPPPLHGRRVLSPAWTGSHARETLISRTHLFLPHDIPQQKNQVQLNLDLHFAINISGNSLFGTPALMKNAERYEW